MGKGDAYSVKYESIELCSQRTKNHQKIQKLPSEIVNPNIELLIYGVQKPKQSLIKPKYKAHEFYMALHTGS